MEQDADDRPFPLEASDGEFYCSACGNNDTGRHLLVVDRNQWIADWQEHIRFCVSCVNGALEE